MGVLGRDAQLSTDEDELALRQQCTDLMDEWHQSDVVEMRNLTPILVDSEARRSDVLNQDVFYECVLTTSF